MIERLGSEILLGDAFAFIKPNAFGKPGLSWLRSVLGKDLPSKGRVVPLLGPDKSELPGASVAPVAIDSLDLQSVTSDRMLYRERADDAHILVVDLLGPNRPATVVVNLNGSEYSRFVVDLDGRGAATLRLRDLPAGQYSVGFLDQEDGCEFTVAEFKLAPLVATLVRQSLDRASGRLTASVRLETFGVPVDGRVRMELHDAGRRVDAANGVAHNGLVDVGFALKGDGPFEIAMHLVDDPSKTASVALTGSRASERSSTLFSKLGYEITGSLLAGDGSREVRGIYLDEGATLTTPFRVERIDTRRMRITVAGPVESAVFVQIDPTFPRARKNAVNVARVPFPGTTNQRYAEGEKLFNAGRIQDAIHEFERGRRVHANPHPFYAYFLACCHARLGDAHTALDELRTALRDGWIDMEHLFSDSDLTSLHGHPEFEALKSSGYAVQEFDQLAAGATVELDVADPVGLVAIGAFVDGAAWEGWAVAMTPSALAPRIDVPRSVAPDSDVTVRIETGARGAASIFVVVKDARLTLADTPTSRLASRIKDWVGDVGKALSIGKVSATLSDAVPPSPPGWMNGAIPPPPTMAFRGGAPPIVQSTVPLPPPAPSYHPAPSFPMSAPMAAPMGAPSITRTGALPNTADFAATLVGSAPGPLGSSTDKAPSTYEKPASVVFAGLLTAENGLVECSFHVDNEFREYVVDAFVVGCGDWAAAQARLEASKNTFVALDLPAFVHPEDGAVGRLTAGCASGRLRVRVSRNGSDLPLAVDSRPVLGGETIEQRRVEISFLAEPGEYVATVEDAESGETEQSLARVEVPGKLTSVARTVRFLNPGEHVSTDDPSILGLKVLPAIDGPFNVLVNATAEYGHACCEQTAAKMLSACAMYMFSDGDGERSRAESIILAGVKREQSMWLKGRGFRMYPESGDSPNEYWGMKAARYLWNLALLRDSGRPLSSALDDAVDKGLEMAADTCKAYKIEWPLQTATSCEEAYAVVRFNLATSARERAVEFVRNTAPVLATDEGKKALAAVAMRTEAAFAAATLLAAGSNADWPVALSLSNTVVDAINESGRLYSTADSVAAIALLGELRSSRVISGGSSQIDVDGASTTVNDAAVLGTGISSVRATTAVVAVEVSRTIEEDWSAFGSNVSASFSLERNNRPGRRFTTGDAIELCVSLVDGYKPGDLLWVCLPDALSRIVGGGQVKRFSMDFEGRAELRIALVCTSVTVDRNGGVAPQHFAACVRNMFEEERVGSPGLLDVTVAPAEASGGSASGLARMYESLRGLLGR